MTVKNYSSYNSKPDYLKRNLKKVLCLTFSALLSSTSVVANEPILLQAVDLQYVGAFRVTYVNQAEGRTGFAPARIVISSATNSFFMNGNPYFAIAEYKIPEILNSENLEDLAFTGPPIQSFTNMFGKAPYTTEQNNLEAIGGMELIDNRLVVSVYDGYDAASSYGFDVDNVMIINDPFDLKNSTVTGYLQMSDKMFAAGWFSSIPLNLRDSLGGDYITGMARQASINGRWSQGPSAYSLFIDDLLNTENGGTIPNLKLQKYPLFNRMSSLSSWNYDNTNCPSFVNDNSLWDASCVVGNDLWTELSMVFYGTIIPGTNTYLTIGRSGGHRKGIAYKNTPIDGPGACSGECPYDWHDWDNYIWFFDVADMIKFKNGLTQEYDAQPYAYGPIKLPFDDINADGFISLISGADYDPQTNRLYISLGRADSKQGTESTPLILVYEINVLPRPSPPPSINKPVVNDK